MKSLFRFLGLMLFLSGWAVVALCVHVVRIPDPANGQLSKLIIVPKNRLGPQDTYVDARSWTMADVKAHPLLVLRVLESGKADEFKFLADPKDKKDVETQLTDTLSGTQAADNPGSNSAVRRSVRSAGFSH